MPVYLICIYVLITMLVFVCSIFMAILIGNRRKLSKVTIENLRQKQNTLYIKYDLKNKDIDVYNNTYLNLDVGRALMCLLNANEFSENIDRIVKEKTGEFHSSQKIDDIIVYFSLYFREKIEDYIIFRCDYTVEKIAKRVEIKTLDEIRQYHHDFENKKACLYYLNVKEFNSINQRYGEKCGDYILEVIKGRLVKNENSHVLCSYLGRDQFVVYLNHKKINKKKAIKFIKDVNSKIIKPVDVGCLDIEFNFGIGVCVGSYSDIDEFVKRAYVAADYAKKRKRYNIVVYNENMKLEDDLIDSYEHELNEILVTREINVEYSPVFYNSKSKFIGYISNPVFLNSNINYETLKKIASQKGEFDQLICTIIESQLVSYLKKRPKKSSKLFLKLKLEDLPAFLEAYLSNQEYSECKIVIYLDVKVGYEMLNKFPYISSAIGKIVEEGIEIALELNYSNMYNYDYILKNSTYLVLDETIVSNMTNMVVKNKVINVIELAKTYDLELLAVDVSEYIQYENLLKYDVNYFSGSYFGKNVRKPNEIEQSKTKIFAKFIKDSKKTKKIK